MDGASDAEGRPVDRARVGSQESAQHGLEAPMLAAPVARVGGRNQSPVPVLHDREPRMGATDVTSEDHAFLLCPAPTRMNFIR